MLSACDLSPRFAKRDARQDARAELRAEGRPFTAADFLDACSRGDLDLCNRYLAAGVDPDAENRHGETSLIIAVRNRNEDVVRLLLSYGAEVNVTDRRGNSAIQLAMTEGDGELTRLLTIARHDAITGD